MKKNNRFSFMAVAVAMTALFVVSCNQSEKVDDGAMPQIRVGVFNGNGGAQTCVWEAFAACSLDGDMAVRYVTTADIAAGALDSLDVIVVPGGGGTRQYQNLGEENVRRIQEFVRQGGGAVGICAGAYLFSNTPEYSCLAMNGAKAIDIEHDNRGHGIVGFSLTDEGKKIFGEYANLDTLFCMYYEGPVFVAAPDDSVKYVEFATMLSDVHEEGGAPSNMTNNRPFFIGNRYGKGKVFSSIAHPESTAGKMWMIARMVRWTQTPDDDDSLQKMVENQSFSKHQDLKNADLVNREILMTVADLKTEADYFKKLVYGTENEKIEALEWLKAHQSWDAKRWIQGALFDGSAKVRAAAAKYIADIHYFTFVKDVRAAYEAETDAEAKKIIGENLEKMLELSQKTQ